MLGRAYEEVNNEYRALRAYVRYVATYITMESKSFDELIDVTNESIDTLNDELNDVSEWMNTAAGIDNNRAMVLESWI